MINKKELRIWNFVEYSNEYVQITDINQDFPTVNMITVDYLEYEEIHAIELNEDWLLKFGFIKNRASNYEIGNFCLFSSSSLGFKVHIKTHDYDKIEIKSVHFLQNIYFLFTGKELFDSSY